MNSMRTVPQPVVLWGSLQTVKNVMYYSVISDIMSVLKITNQEPVSYNSLLRKSFLTWMVKTLCSSAAVKKSSLAVRVTFVVRWVNEGLKDISNFIIILTIELTDSWNSMSAQLQRSYQGKSKIHLHAPIPPFRPGPVHSGLANWDDCGQVFPHKLHVTLFCQEILTLCLDSIVSQLGLCWHLCYSPKSKTVSFTFYTQLFHTEL